MNGGIGRQGGFLGLIVILIALLIVAWLTMDALTQYGAMSKAGPPPKSAPTATPAPPNALDKARGLEGTVREQAAEQSRQIDEATKTGSPRQ